MSFSTVHRAAARLRVSGSATVTFGLAVIVAVLLNGCGQTIIGPVSSRACVYSGHTLSGLKTFDELVNARIDCVVLFADAAPNWAAWEKPWFIDNAIPNDNWSSFGSQRGHRLIITVNLLPVPLTTGTWRAVGAAGGYAPYARTLAGNLVRAGLGHATIRLGHEANGDWYPDNVGTTPTEWSQWKQFWRATVLAMRSVPGAHFKFNWCIAAGYRAIPFSAYYPGNDVVDSIGVDIYDSGVPSGSDRWSYQYERAGGVSAVVRFAHAHHKPLSIPEWGLASVAAGGGGDDETFTDGIVNLMRTAPVSYEAYFFADDSRTVLLGAENTLGVYRTDLIHR